MVIYTVKEFWGCLKDMKEKWNAERGVEGGGTLICVKLSKKEEKNCAIFICPYRETVATIPAIDLILADKLKLISIPQITKFYNLAQLRL